MYGSTLSGVAKQLSVLVWNKTTTHALVNKRQSFAVSSNSLLTPIVSVSLSVSWVRPGGSSYRRGTVGSSSSGSVHRSTYLPTAIAQQSMLLTPCGDVSFPSLFIHVVLQVISILSCTLLALSVLFYTAHVYQCVSWCCCGLYMEAVLRPDRILTLSHSSGPCLDLSQSVWWW